jgi:uncharacterized protein
MNIDAPFQIASDGRTALTSDDDHIADMIVNVLLTRPGERVNRPEFGCGLAHFVHAKNSPELAAATQFTAHAELQQCLGDIIELSALTVEARGSTLALFVSYIVRRTGERRDITRELGLP